MNLTLSLAQIQIQFGQPSANLEQARAQVAEAVRRGSQMILFPELWSSGYALAQAHALAQENAALLPELARLAQTLDISIGGSLLLEKEGRVYNTFLYQSPGGQASAYDKIHLFRLMEEERWITAGDHLQQVSVPWGQTGLAICYDLRFPELFRRYALDGVELMLISAEWPAARIAHWQTLLRARAIENQCFIAAVNAVGSTGGETFGGCSAVISPWGEVLMEGSSDQPKLLTVTIDMAQVQQVRQRIPVFQDRRPDLYER